ncbi:MAG: DUF4838 domain-containing protein [Oscillospiraceae bacterium]|jgi:hypothetical protein|nr:DUF4838 domain-containing protein [Oscillospiraceae bacterium]
MDTIFGMTWGEFYAIIDGFIRPITAWFLSITACISIPIQSLLYPAYKEYVPPEQTAVVYGIEGGEELDLTDWKIVYNNAANAANVTAATALQTYINRCTGVTLPIAQDSTAAGTKEILVGQTNRETAGQIDRTAIPRDGYTWQLDSAAEQLFLTGATGRGTLQAVYKFLDKFFGVKFYTSSIIVTPAAESLTITIPEDYTYSYVPPFFYRDTNWNGSPANATYWSANGLSGGIQGDRAANIGGSIYYAQRRFAHTIIAYVLPYAANFDAHPEWYSLRKAIDYIDFENPNESGPYLEVEGGYRVPEQLCLTNPEVLQQVVNYVKSVYQGPEKIVSLTQRDNQYYCECDNCAAVDAEEGSHAGTLIRFMNAVSDELAKDPAYDGLQLDTFAYMYSRHPCKTAPNPNVIVRLCSWECCFAHTLNDPNCEVNTTFANDLKGWSELTDNIYIWDYTTDFSHFNSLFPDFQVLQPNLQFFREYGVKGVFEQGGVTGSIGTEFAELRAYLLASLLYDPDIDFNAALEGFCSAFYGDGGPYIAEFIRQTMQSVGKKPDVALTLFKAPSTFFNSVAGGSIWEKLFGTKSHMGIYENPASGEVLQMKANTINYCDALWTKAKELAAPNATYLNNVRRSEISWRYVKACTRMGEFAWTNPTASWQREVLEFYYDLRTYAGTTYAELDSLRQSTPDVWSVPSEWGKSKET